jgi:hypothetical protein
MTWTDRRGSKYGAKSTEFEGVVYHSKKEAGRAAELHLLERAKQITNIRRQVKISIDVCVVCSKLVRGACIECHRRTGFASTLRHITNYYIDFVYHDVKKDTEVYEEVKGFSQPIWQLKWALTEALLGDDETIELLVTR